MERDENEERELENSELKREFMYEQEVRQSIENLLRYKYGRLGLDAEEISTSTVAELTRAVAIVTEEDMTAQLTRKSIGSVLVYTHKSETTPHGFRFLAFGHK